MKPDGRCRGRVKVTLVSTPPLDPRFGSEFVRVNTDATLQQEKRDGKWGRKLEPLHLPTRNDAPRSRPSGSSTGSSGVPVKVHAKTFKRGVGASSNWRLFIDYRTRAGEVMPAEGVPFTVIVTISDTKDEQPVSNDMRQNLQALGTPIADTRAAYDAYCAAIVWTAAAPATTFQPVHERGPGFTTRCFGVSCEDGTSGRFPMKKALSAIAE